MNSPRVGVYICHCGGNISDTVDIEKVKNTVSHFKGVEITEAHEYMCSNLGQDMIKQDITQKRINRVVVASCSPRMHLETFRRAVESAGLNPYLLDMVNLREQCSWVHDDKEPATLKAIDIIRGAAERARYLEPLEPERIGVNRDVVIIGGGIAGMVSAIELADNGYHVYIVEKSPSIGGHMAQISKTFPTLDCSSCILTPRMVYASQHSNIDILSMSEVESVEGSPGNYRVKIRKRPRYVDEDKCTSCGDCSKVCPVDILSEFEEDMGTRNAIYIPFPQAIPNAYVIDKRGIPPCSAACPAGVNVQGYVALVSQGKFEEAIELIRKDNPFPAVCGRVCFHPCESECERNKVDTPISINAIKRFVADYELRKRKRKPQPTSQTHKEKVAVIGSGPAGLTAAYHLVKMGYPVTVFESLPHPGGMLRYGIPSYRLPKEILDSEIDYLRDLGVEIRTCVTIGEDLGFDTLVAQGYKAIFAAVGNQKSRRLWIEGEELGGVIHALDFLKEVNQGEEPSLGEKVIVVGGGNVAIDASRTALRLGAKEVTIIYRRSRTEMPANSGEAQQSELEGVNIDFLVSPKRIKGENGRVSAVECLQMELGEPDESGRRKPIPLEGSEFTIKADSLIVAIGEQPDTSFMPLEAETTNSGGIAVDPLTMQTSIPYVFAGGDVVGSPATVIEAIAQGKNAAVSIDRFLRGQDLRSGREEVVKRVKDVPKKGVQEESRQVMPLLPVNERSSNFEEVELGFTEDMAIREAGRCLSCGGCSSCLECIKSCKTDAIDFGQEEEIIELDAGAIIVATGFEQIEADRQKEYSFGLHPDIITNLQFERLMIQGLHRPSDGGKPKKVAFVLCVGSRMMDGENGEKHCCKIGCMTAIKQSLLLLKAIPDAEPWIFYIDVRADGKGYEEFYMNAQEHGVKFVRGKVAEMTRTERGVFLRAEDTTLGALIEGYFDMVVLSPGIVPSSGSAELAKELGIQIGADGFFLERHYKLMPVDSQRRGVYIGGCALGPKDVRETTLEALATSSRVATFLHKGEVSIPPEVAYVDSEKCDSCGECIGICPVNAIGASGSQMKINPISCVGCGICVPRCPKQAIDLNHCNEAQILAQIRGVSEEGNPPRIIAFLEGNTAYASADLAGQNRLSYSPLVKIIRVPSTGRLGPKHLLTAFASGADGAVFIEGDDSVFDEKMLREHIIQLKNYLNKNGIRSLRLIHTSTTIPQYSKMLNVFDTFVSRIAKIGPIPSDERLKIAEILEKDGIPLHS